MREKMKKIECLIEAEITLRNSMDYLMANEK